MTRPGLSRARRGEGRQSLIRATVEVVGEYGIAGATVRRIAAHAGVDNTLITHYFGSRERLLEEAARWGFDEHVRVAEVTIDFALDDRSRAGLVETVAADPVLQAFMFEIALAGRRQPALRGPITELYDGFIAKMRASLRRRGLPDDIPFARAVFAMVDGLVFQQVSDVATAQEVSAALEGFGRFLRAVPMPPVQAVTTGSSNSVPTS